MPTSFQLHYTNGSFVSTEVEHVGGGGVGVENNGTDIVSAKTLGSSSSTSFSVASACSSTSGGSQSTIVLPSTNNNGGPADISLGWRNLRYEITPPLSNNKRVILRRLNGHVRYRTMTGFMGPSGAGKTTLLNCLNGNIRSLSPGSELYVNQNEPKMPVCGFIEQHVQDTIVGRLTVREVLRFAYRFKNSTGRWKNASTEMDRHINHTLTELMLDHQILDRKFQYCSGGEQKRVAIAQELMSVDRKPELLFIDEPTTGLDSQAALEVMRCLRNLTVTYRITVLVSIHLPSDEILRMFDQLYILAKGGVAIYAGPPDNLRENLRCQLAIEIDDDKPPVEEYLKIACHGLQDRRVRHLADQTLSNEYIRLTPYIDHQQLRFLSAGMPGTRKNFSIGHFFLQLYRIFYLVFFVDFRIISYQLLVYILFFLTISTVFDSKMVQPSMCYPLDMINGTTGFTCQEQVDDRANADSYITYQAFCVMFFGVIMMGLGSILFTPMLKMFRHEHRNGWYSMSSFYWPFVLVRLLEITLFSLVITVLIYFPTEHHRVDGYQINWNRLGHFGFFIWLSCFYMQTYGQLLSLIFLDRLEISIVVAQLWFIQLSMVNGYLINLGHINIPVLFMVSDLLATNPISKGLLYSFYGLDRCDPEREYSVILMKFDVDPEKVFTGLSQVWINIAIIRMATFVLMYLRFSVTRPWVPAGPPSTHVDPIPIDYETGYHHGIDLTPHHQVDMSRISRIKHDKEQRFEQFSRNKIIVAWRTLSLFASSSIKEIRPVRPGSKLILRNLNGQFRFGTMNALMGTSGAGKTSLLKVLNGRLKTKLSEETRIYLSRYTPIRICFITQDVSGHLLPGLTAKQSLVYASRLKNSNETPETGSRCVLNAEEHEQIAMNLLDELDIAETENTLVQHCSGGERKRLALALELTALRMPNLICIDEPTSGLDSNSAHVVVSCLRRLVQHHNLTIVASIHQPNTETLMMFDQCYVLARGGVSIYSGPPGQISQYLSLVPEIGSGMGESEFAIERLIKYSASNYRDPIVAKLVTLNEQRITGENGVVAEEAQQVADGIQHNRPRFSLRSVRILCHRYTVYMRGHLWLSWAIYIIIYLFYGLTLRLFFDRRIAFTNGCIDLEDDFHSTCTINEDRLQMEMDLASNYRYNFYINAIFLFIVVLQTSLNFSKESIYFFNEHRNGWYSTGAYYLMKSIYDMLPMIPVLFIYIWTVNIYEPIRPGIFWYLLSLMMISVFAIQGMGHIMALLTRGHFTLLTITNIGVFLFLVILSNFFNPIQRMHYIYRFIANFSICRFMNEATMLLQYGFGRCGPKEIQATLYVMVINDDDHFYHCIQMLFFNLIFYRLASLAILVARSNPLENRRERAEKIRKRYQEQISQPLETIIPGLTNCDHRFYVKQFQI